MHEFEETLVKSHKVNERGKRMQRIISALSLVNRALQVEIDTASSDLASLDESDIRIFGAISLQLSRMNVNTSEVTNAALENTTRLPDNPPDYLVDVSTYREATDDMPNNEPSVQLHMPVNRERQASYEGELYSRIVSVEEIPHTEQEKEVAPIPIHVISDNTVALNGETLTLKGHRLFVFNAFLKLRGEESITAGDIKTTGFSLPPSRERENTNILSMAIRDVRERLQSMASSESGELIAKQGDKGNTSYSVNPAITIIDDRLELENKTSQDSMALINDPQGIYAEDSDHPSQPISEIIDEVPTVTEGSVVTIKFLDGRLDAFNTFHLIDRSQAASIRGSVSLLCTDQPMAKVLLGAREDEVLTFKAKKGNPLSVKVLSIQQSEKS